MAMILKNHVHIILFALLLLILGGLFIQSTINNTNSVQRTYPKIEDNYVFPDDVNNSEAFNGDSREIGGLYIGFKEGVNETQSSRVLENYSLIKDCRIDYNIDYLADRYYIMVDNDKKSAIKIELMKAESWIDSSPDIEKRNYSIIHVWRPLAEDNDFLEILDKQNLHLSEFYWCYISFNGKIIDYETGENIKKEIEENEDVLIVSFDDVEG
jgi:hypothetical protein